MKNCFHIFVDNNYVFPNIYMKNAFQFLLEFKKWCPFFHCKSDKLLLLLLYGGTS